LGGGTAKDILKTTEREKKKRRKGGLVNICCRGETTRGTRVNEIRLKKAGCTIFGRKVTSHKTKEEKRKKDFFSRKIEVKKYKAYCDNGGN